MRSKPLGITCGIPQGSCLGPLLFIVYLNDFEKCLYFSSASMYADDTHTTIASDDINELAQMMQEELQNISEWMRVNKLTVNPNKTEFIFIGHPCRINKIETLAPLKLNNTEIKRVRKTKSLGVIVDENLSWKEHFKSLKGKVTRGLSALKKLKSILPQSKLCEVYHALVESHPRYQNVVWGSLPNTKLQTLQRLQNRAFPIIENARLKDPWNNDGLSVDQIIYFDRSIMAHEIVNQQCPESLWNKYTQRNEISRYNTINNRNNDIPKLKLECKKKGFHLSGLKAWNEIPIEIRETPSLYQFKRKLKTHLKSSANPN